MIPFHTTPPHAAEGVSLGLQQTAETHKAHSLSTADLFGLGFVLIITILLSRQLVISLYKRHQLNRLVVLLGRRATLERQLYRRASSKPPSSHASSQHP